MTLSLLKITGQLFRRTSLGEGLTDVGPGEIQVTCRWQGRSGAASSLLPTRLHVTSACPVSDGGAHVGRSAGVVSARLLPGKLPFPL